MRDPVPPYRLTVDDAPAPMLVYDTATGRIVDVNEPACALYGYDRDTFLGLRLDDLRPDEDVELLRERLAEAGADEVVRREGVRHERSDGTRFHVSLEAHPLRLPDRTLRTVFLRSEAGAWADREARARQSLLFQGIEDAVIFTDATGFITDWNPAAERLWGYTRAEALGRRASFLHGSGEEGESLVDWILSAVAEEEVWEGVLETEARDGTARVSVVRVLPIHDDAGNRVGTVGINHDITHRRRVERALAETTQDFRILANQIPHILWITDAAGVTQYTNEEWRRLTGQDPADAVRGDWEAVLHPEDRGPTMEKFAGCVASGREFVHEHRLRSADGDYRWHVSRATPIRNQQGEIIRWLGSSVDIHPQKTAEDRVRRREEYFRGVFENAHDAIVLFDRESGGVLDANPQAETLYGMSRAELLMQRIENLYPEISGIDEYLRQLAEDGFGTHLVQQKSRSLGPIQVEVNAALMDHRGRRVLLTLNRDATERRQLERQLQQAQKMEAIGRLAGGLAHDFNNLTTAIQGFASILTDELQVQGEARDALREIDRAARRASDLTRQLLAYTRQQVMRGRVLDLNAVVESARQLIARLIGEDIRVTTQLAADLGQVRADPGQLDQVLMNLAVNARDAMAGGGRFILETRNVTLDRAFAENHPPAEPGEYVLLRVADTGHGMDEETRARAFEPFYTTKGVGEGTGLGLATVYGIVKQSGGYVWVESEEGVGTVFDIYLPRVDERPVDREVTAPVAEPVEAEPVPGDGASETVLLVEDEDGVRKLAQRVLERAGYRVLPTPNGVAALELASTTEHDIDLVLTDMVMPRMSGKELVRELGLTRPDTPVLYMSGYTGESLAERGDLTRTDVVLEKPFKPAELVEAVRKQLHDEAE